MRPDRPRAWLGLRSIRGRLIAAYTLVIALPFVLFGWAMVYTLDRYYLARLQADMIVEARLIAEQAAEALTAGGSIEVPDLLIDPPPPLRTQARVLLFDASGALAGASDPAFERFVGTALVEPGLEAALQGRASQGSEHSASAGGPVSYVAQPVVAGGQVVGAVHLAYTLADIQSAQRALSAAILGATLLAAALTSLISLATTSTITQPLARLSAAATDIAGGLFSRRVIEEPPAELAALARSFNRMAAALEHADQARRETFANIAHDLRTPLGSLRAAAEALASGAAEQVDLRERLLGGMIDQLHYLSRLTDDLLRLATYEGGGLVLRQQAVDLRPLVRRAVQDVEPRAQANSVRLEAELPGEPIIVQADADRVLEALFNLLDNALTYTPAAGQIRVWVEAADAFVWLHVSDTGPGLPKEAIARLAQRYWRAQRGSAGARSGAAVNMGLGLSIVREIARAHGGSLAAGNRPEGGANFAFSLPLAGLSQP